MKRDKRIVGLDVGTTKICACIGHLNGSGQLEVVGAGLSPSRGMKKGLVVNLEETVSSIKAAVEQAESRAGTTVDTVLVGLAGPHLKGMNSRGVINLEGRSREVSLEDIQNALEVARNVEIPADREMMHLLPQEFVLDGQEGIVNPLGMMGQRLEVSVHLVIGSVPAAQNLVASVNRSGLEVSRTVLQSLASSESVLTPDEKELGVLVVDIGGGTTDLAVFQRNAVWHTAVLPSGGEHITRDLAIGLRTPLEDAERLKRECGCAVSSLVPREESVEVPTVGGRPSRGLSRQILGEIIQARAEEILGLVRDDLVLAGFEGQLTSGAVLTGGGALLYGLAELAEQILEMPVRVGFPMNLPGLTDEMRNPVYSTAVGLVMHGAQRWTRTPMTSVFQTTEPGGFFSRTTQRMRSALTKLLM
ncbi:MAG: cell division protein FtsA [Acidobacteria bacterium]|nr:cell division protein FtsA [Acidobacteriota bacterium]